MLRNLIIAAVLNAALSFFEWLYFKWGNSMPMNAAYLHDAADAVTCVVFFILMKGIQKAPYLHNVATVGTGAIMIWVTSKAFMQAMEHMRNPQAIKTEFLFFAAIFSFCVNAVMALNLHKGKTAVEKIFSLHFLQDAGASAAMLLSWAVSFAVNQRDESLLDAFIAVEVTGGILILVIWSTGKALINLLAGDPELPVTPAK